MSINEGVLNNVKLTGCNQEESDALTAKAKAFLGTLEGQEALQQGKETANWFNGLMKQT